MNTLVDTGVLVGVGYFCYSIVVFRPQLLPLLNKFSTKTPTTIKPLDQNKNEAEHLALIFRERLNDLSLLVLTGVLDTSTMLALRDDISYRFAVTSKAIAELEMVGALDEASSARLIIKSAIEDYRQRVERVGITSITADLSLYEILVSKFPLKLSYV